MNNMECIGHKNVESAQDATKLQSPLRDSLFMHSCMVKSPDLNSADTTNWKGSFKKITWDVDCNFTVVRCGFRC